jgi:hypothetical protein
MIRGEVSPLDGAMEISAPVDPMGGPAVLTREQWDLYIEFYGWVNQWQESEQRRPGEALPPDLVASYEAELLRAAREVLARDDSDSR